MNDDEIPIASPLECILMRPIDEADLLERLKEEGKAQEANGFQIFLEVDASTAVALVGHLQLAMRHPANTGPTVSRMKAVIDGIREMFEDAGYTATVEVIDLGFDRSMDRK